MQECSTTGEYCHKSCVDLLGKEYKILEHHLSCDCPIYDYEYDAYLYSKGLECWCDGCDYSPCSDCANKYGAYCRSELDKICVKCEGCKEDESTCCLSGYYTVGK